jgi:hypothetical protein
MAVDVTIYPQTVVWNGQTYNSANGGPLSLRYSLPSRIVEERTGDDKMPRGVYIVDQGARVWFRMRAAKWTTARGTKSDLVATLLKKTGGGTVTLTFADMVLVNAGGNQDRAAQGELELEFAYESDDGQTDSLT